MMVDIDANHALEIGAGILSRLGAPPDTARTVSASLVESDLSGHTSHGISKVLDYAGRIRSGEIDPVAMPAIQEDSGHTILIDGHKCFGHVAARMLVETLAERVTNRGIVLGGIVNVSHTGRLGEWGELAARRGMALMLFSASVNRSGVAAHGAGEPRLGTNPLVWAVPGQPGDFVLDIATSAVAGARLKQLADAGAPAPAGSIVDATGSPTSDPTAIEQGGMLLTFGEHKGYGISLFAALLAGCIAGAAGEDTSTPAVVAIGIDPGVFAPGEKVARWVTDELEHMRSTPPRTGFDRVEVPGDYEQRNRDQSRGWLSLNQSTWQQLRDLAAELDLEMPPSP